MKGEGLEVRLPELRQMRCFREVARAQHFGRAARALGISQSAFTEQIQRLEETVGTILLDRDRKGVRLTAAGAAFLVEAEAVLSRIEAAVQAARGTTGAQTPRLHIGYSAAVFGTGMPAVIRRLKSEMPELDLRMFERSGIDTEKAMFEEGLDCLIVAFPSSSAGVKTLDVGETSLMACLPTGHRLCAKDVIDLADLDDEAMIFAEEYPHRRFHNAFFGACARAGATPRIAHRAGHQLAVFTLVASGLGIGLTPSSVALSSNASIEFRPLGRPPFSVPSVLVWRSDNGNPAVEALIEIARGSALQTKPI